MDKVINSNTGKSITVGGKLYNTLIGEGYVLKKGVLQKPNRIHKEQTQEEIIEYKRPQFVQYDNRVEYYALPNVRCIECNTPITKYNRYRELIQEGLEPVEAYEALNIKRLCCRKEYG